MSVKEMKNYLSNYKKISKSANKMENILCTNRKYKSVTEKNLKKTAVTLNDMLSIISSVKNDFNRDLLFRKYIKGETLEELGESIGYSARHVQRLLNKAIEEMINAN